MNRFAWRKTVASHKPNRKVMAYNTGIENWIVLHGIDGRFHCVERRPAAVGREHAVGPPRRHFDPVTRPVDERVRKTPRSAVDEHDRNRLIHIILSSVGSAPEKSSKLSSRVFTDRPHGSRIYRQTRRSYLYSIRKICWSITIYRAYLYTVVQ